MAVITASPKNFSRLLELQEQTLDQMSTIRHILQNTTSSATSTGGGAAAVMPSTNDDLIVVQKENNDLLKETNRSRKEQIKKMDEEAEIIASLAENFKTFRSPLEKLKDGLNGVTSAFKNPGRSLMKSLNIGGIFNKQIAKSEFVEKQKSLGSEKSTKELRADFETANTAAKEIQKNEAKIEKLKKSTGLSESKLAQTPEGRKLLDARAAGSEKYKSADLGAQLTTSSSSGTAATSIPIPASIPAVIPSPTQQAADGAAAEEQQMENARLMDEQTTLLEKIEANTRGGGTGASSGAPGPSSSGEGGGLLGGIGAGLSGLGKGLGKGLEGVLKGVGAGVRGLARGVAALANPASLLGLAAFTAAMIGIGAALRLAAPAIEAFAPVLMKVAEVIGTVFVEAIKTIPAVIESVGTLITGIISTISDSIIGIIDAVTDSIERLSQVDGGALLGVAGGLTALAGAMVLFGGAQALAGIGNLVGKLLSFGGDSPVEQIIKIGQSGEGIIKAAEGIEKLGTTVGKLGDIDGDKLEAFDDFPWKKATEFVKAGGAMEMNGAKVYNASAANAEAATSNTGGSSNTVVAPTTVNNSRTTTVTGRSPIRNQDQTQQRLSSKLLNW